MELENQTYMSNRLMKIGGFKLQVPMEDLLAPSSSLCLPSPKIQLAPCLMCFMLLGESTNIWDHLGVHYAFKGQNWPRNPCWEVLIPTQWRLIAITSRWPVLRNNFPKVVTSLLLVRIVQMIRRWKAFPKIFNLTCHIMYKSSKNLHLI